MVILGSASYLPFMQMGQWHRRQVIEDIIGAEAFSQLSLNQISATVAKAHNLTDKQLIGKSRTMEFVNARHIAMFLCRDMTKTSLNNIGAFFNNRDHSTVIHACKTIEEKINSDAGIKKDIKDDKFLEMWGDLCLKMGYIGFFLGAIFMLGGMAMPPEAGVDPAAKLSASIAIALITVLYGLIFI